MHWAQFMVKKGVLQGTPSAKGTVNKQDLAQRFKLWFIQMRTGIHTRVSQGLSQAVPTPLIHSSTFTSLWGTLGTSEKYMPMDECTNRQTYKHTPCKDMNRIRHRFNLLEKVFKLLQT